jgi:hypothetical protein
MIRSVSGLLPSGGDELVGKEGVAFRPIEDLVANSGATA